MAVLRMPRSEGLETAATNDRKEDAMAQIQERYKAAPFGGADTWRISDTQTGELISVVKGPENLKRRLAQLNGEDTLRQGSVGRPEEA